MAGGVTRLANGGGDSGALLRRVGGLGPASPGAQVEVGGYGRVEIAHVDDLLHYVEQAGYRIAAALFGEQLFDQLVQGRARLYSCLRCSADRGCLHQQTGRAAKCRDCPQSLLSGSSFVATEKQL